MHHALRDAAIQLLFTKNTIPDIKENGEAYCTCPCSFRLTRVHGEKIILPQRCRHIKRKKIFLFTELYGRECLKFFTELTTNIFFCFFLLNIDIDHKHLLQFSEGIT
jgi:hypothetical protein